MNTFLGLVYESTYTLYSSSAKQALLCCRQLSSKSPPVNTSNNNMESHLKLDRRVSKRPVLAVIALHAARRRSFPLITKCTQGLTAVLQVFAVSPAIVLHGHVFIIQSQLLVNGNK